MKADRIVHWPATLSCQHLTVVAPPPMLPLHRFLSCIRGADIQAENRNDHKLGIDDYVWRTW
jgi:hypothetical protein